MSEHVYVDEPIGYPDHAIKTQAKQCGNKWCHMWCDDGHEEELHAIARRIGLKRSWFQDHRYCSHYDLVPNKRTLALKAGAKSMNMRIWLMKKLKAKR